MRYLCYRGRSYEFFQSAWGLAEATKLPPNLSDAETTLVQLLRYRGVFYIRLVRVWPVPTGQSVMQPLHRRLGLGADSLSIGATAFSIQISSIETQAMGHLYRLYWLGWKQGSQPFLKRLHHTLLRVFFNYRRGYTAGRE